MLYLGVTIWVWIRLFDPIQCKLSGFGFEKLIQINGWIQFDS